MMIIASGDADRRIQRDARQITASVRFVTCKVTMFALVNYFYVRCCGYQRWCGAPSSALSSRFVQVDVFLIACHRSESSCEMLSDPTRCGRIPQYDRNPFGQQIFIRWKPISSFESWIRCDANPHLPCLWPGRLYQLQNFTSDSIWAGG